MRNLARSISLVANTIRAYNKSPALLLIVLISLVNAVPYANAQMTEKVLVFQDVYKSGVNGVRGLIGAATLTMSPDGHHVYASGQQSNAVAVFDRDSNTGLLTYMEMVQDGVDGIDGLGGATWITISTDGFHVYVTGFTDSALAVFKRDPGSGVLSFVEMYRDGINGVDGLAGAMAVCMSPEGSHVYVTGELDSAISVFHRDETTGALSFLEMKKDGVGGIDGLAGPGMVAVSNDGINVYAAGFADDAVTVFRRDSVSGTLEFQEMIKNGVNGVQGLDGAFSVTVSEDGRYVYVVGFLDNAVAVFERNSITGALTYSETVSGYDIDESRNENFFIMTIDPADSYAYVTMANSNALAVYDRDADTGKLYFRNVLRNGIDGIDGLGGISMVAADSTGEYLYITGTKDNAVSVFAWVDAGAISTGVELNTGAGNPVYVLKQNYPNPFNARTIISFEVFEPCEVTVTIHNSTGERIYTVMDEACKAGIYTRMWDARNDGGKLIASGVYFMHIQAGNFIDVRKMVFLR